MNLNTLRTVLADRGLNFLGRKSELVKRLQGDIDRDAGMFHRLNRLTDIGRLSRDESAEIDDDMEEIPALSSLEEDSREAGEGSPHGVPTDTTYCRLRGVHGNEDDVSINASGKDDDDDDDGDDDDDDDDEDDDDENDDDGDGVGVSGSGEMNDKEERGFRNDAAKKETPKNTPESCLPTPSSRPASAQVAPMPTVSGKRPRSRSIGPASRRQSENLLRQVGDLYKQLAVAFKSPRADKAITSAAGAGESSRKPVRASQSSVEGECKDAIDEERCPPPILPRPTWHCLSEMGERPCPLAGHAMVAHSGILFVFGGLFSGLPDEVEDWRRHGQHSNALMQFCPEKKKWDYLSRSCDNNPFLPKARRHHSMVFQGGSLWIYGGFDSDNRALDDMWRFDINKMRWHPINSPGPRQSVRSETDDDGESAWWNGNMVHPGPRAEHTAVVSGENMILYVIFCPSSSIVEIALSTSPRLSSYIVLTSRPARFPLSSSLKDLEGTPHC